MERQYSSIKELPPAFRRFNGGALSDEDAIRLVNEAQAEADEDKKPFSPIYSRVKNEFMATREIVRGFWVPKSD